MKGREESKREEGKERGKRDEDRKGKDPTKFGKMPMSMSQ